MRMTREQREKFIDTKVAELMEVCDTVQIHATFESQECTEIYHTGAGNFYARLASAREFLIRQDEYTRHNARIVADDPD